MSFGLLMEGVQGPKGEPGPAQGFCLFKNFGSYGK